MATTEVGRRLTEAHRLAQVGLVADSLRDVLAVWKLLDPARLDSTFPDYARALIAVLSTRRDQSAAISAAYLRAFREAEGATGPFDVALARALSHEQAMTSLLVTGPVAVKVATRAGKPIEQASQVALVQTLGASARIVQSGGRDTVYDSVSRDQQAYGAARVTSGMPCSFCAMLASRGAVYRDEMSASFEAHDHCTCTSEPVYSTEDWQYPGGDQAQSWRDLYDESTADTTGDGSVAAFRKAYNSKA